MRVYVICDLEGTAGVVDFKQQCQGDGPFYAQARRWASAELSAVVDGAFAAGATEVVAWDGHGEFPGGLEPGTVDRRCKLLLGASEGGPVGLDGSYHAMILLGLHGMAGAEYGVLAHSFVPFVAKMTVNSVPLGEIGMNIHLAGAQGVPCVLVTGDEAAAVEATRLVPAIKCAAVKQGLATQQQPVQTVPVQSLTPAAACELIRDTTLRALKNSKEIQPFTYKPPYTMRTVFTEARFAERVAARTGVVRIDEFTVELQCGGAMQPLL